MKLLKHTTLFVFLFVIISSFSPKKDKRYIGVWKGQDQGDVGLLTLTKDRYATFEFVGDVMGGESYDHQGIKAALKYRVNTKKEPYTIDFIIWDKKKAIEVGKMRGIIKMITDDKMQMAINFSGSNYRPDHFNGNSILFTRIKD